MRILLRYIALLLLITISNGKKVSDYGNIVQFSLKWPPPLGTLASFSSFLILFIILLVLNSLPPPPRWNFHFRTAIPHRHPSSYFSLFSQPIFPPHPPLLPPLLLLPRLPLSHHRLLLRFLHRHLLRFHHR